MEEKKHLQLLEKAEEKRQTIITPFFDEKYIDPEERTVTNLLQLIDDEREKIQLEESLTLLTESIVKLKQNEQLNQQLIQQSMQFIQLSLEMMSPTIQNVNYSKDQKNQDTRNRSMFDSKA